MGFRATLNFRKFKVALNPMYRIFFYFWKTDLHHLQEYENQRYMSIRENHLHTIKITVGQVLILKVVHLDYTYQL